MSLIVTFAVMFDLSAAQAFAQENPNPQSNTNSARPPRNTRTRTRATQPPPAAPVAAEPAPAAAGTQSATATPAPRPRRRRARASSRATGIPTGVQACLNRLTELASADPLPDYDGQAANIVNNGLLWNDEKSKCSIGTDASLRLKLFELGNAWRRKDASTVRSTLEQIKSAAPQG
jgi:hypothetical protein